MFRTLFNLYNCLKFRWDWKKIILMKSGSGSKIMPHANVLGISLVSLVLVHRTKVIFDSQCRFTENLVKDNNTAVIGGCITKPNLKS